MKKSIDDLKETIKSDKKELKDKVFDILSSTLYVWDDVQRDTLLIASFSMGLLHQVENDYTDLKRRVELETNEIRDKQQVG